jgi:plastocyanin
MLGLIVVIAGLGTGCHHGEAKPGPQDGASLDFTSKATVSVDDTGFSPSEVRVQVGNAITLVNRGARDHGLTSSSVEAGTLHPGESTLVFLTSPGRIDAYDPTDASHKLVINVSATGT